MHMNNLITKHWKHVFIACLFSPVAEAQVDGFNKGAGNVDVVASLSYEKGLAYYLAEGTAAIKRSRIAATLFAAGASRRIWICSSASRSSATAPRRAFRMPRST